MSGTGTFGSPRPFDIPVPADSVVDPRIGSFGPALLALEDGTTAELVDGPR